MSMEASYHREYDHCLAKWLNQAGVKTQYVEAETVGLPGNSHVMMNEKKYLSLTPQQRSILHQAAKAGGRAYAAESERGFTDKKAKAVKEFGVTILEPDLGPWRKRSEQVLAKLESEGVIPKGLAAKAKALK